jgi:hypothetical protein
VVVDKKVAEAIDRAKKDEVLDDNAELPIPNDGIDHLRWPSEARRLATLLLDAESAGMTQEELGKACGYSLRSVQRYLADPAFKAYVNELADKTYEDDLKPLFVQAMKRGLKSGNSKFVELYMKSRGMLKEVRQTVADVNINDKRDTSNDALDDELARLEKEALGGEVN